MSVDDWYIQVLQDYEKRGASDADAGVFELPHPGVKDDPDADDINAAYQAGFNKRRSMLGKKFRWSKSGGRV